MHYCYRRRSLKVSWCSWLSRSPHTRKVSGSNPDETIRMLLSNILLSLKLLTCCRLSLCRCYPFATSADLLMINVSNRSILYMHWQDCSQSPGEVSAQRDAARTIWQQEEDLQKLQDRVSVLVHAKETDGRRFKQIAMERQREREELKREVERLKVSH